MGVGPWDSHAQGTLFCIYCSRWVLLCIATLCSYLSAFTHPPPVGWSVFEIQMVWAFVYFQMGSTLYRLCTAISCSYLNVLTYARPAGWSVCETRTYRALAFKR